MLPALGTVIRERRQSLGLSQDQFAVRVGEGTSQTDISRLERGIIMFPRMHRFLAIARALDLLPSELIALAERFITVPGEPVVPVPAPTTRSAWSEVRLPIGLIHRWETAQIDAT